MWTIQIIRSIGLSLALFLGIGASPAVAQRMIAIASIYPVSDITQRIGGERWEVTTLIPAGASPHTYEPTPEQVRQLSQARVFLQIGLGLEFWLEKLVLAAKNPALVISDLSKGLDILPAPYSELPHASQPSPSLGLTHLHPTSPQWDQEGFHRHAGADAHYWLDPVRMQQVVVHIERQLAGLDPDHAMQYAERAQRVRADLENLHTEILQRTRGLQNRHFIALHAAWTYFAPRYNLVQAAVIEPFPGREPSPRYLAELTLLMRRDGVKAIVIEPQLTAVAAKTLARETGARVGMMDPYGGPGVPGRQDYMGLMRYNVAELVKLLK